MSQVHEIESVFMNGSSNLEVICGPMFSGKTEELIRRIRRVEYAKLSAVVFKPAIDVRYDHSQVVSHSAQKMGSIPVADSSEIRMFLRQHRFHVVGLDEAQFFDDGVVDLCEELVLSNIRVIVAGLSEDFLGRPFGPMPLLLSHADVVTKLWAVCMSCGRPASKSQRISRDGTAMSEEQVLVGASHCYEARCRGCHKRTVLSEQLGLDENVRHVG